MRRCLLVIPDTGRSLAAFALLLPFSCEPIHTQDILRYILAGDYIPPCYG